MATGCVSEASDFMPRPEQAFLDKWEEAPKHGPLQKHRVSTVGEEEE